MVFVITNISNDKDHLYLFARGIDNRIIGIN